MSVVTQDASTSFTVKTESEVKTEVKQEHPTPQQVKTESIKVKDELMMAQTEVPKWILEPERPARVGCPRPPTSPVRPQPPSKPQPPSLLSSTMPATQSSPSSESSSLSVRNDLFQNSGQGPSQRVQFQVFRAEVHQQQPNVIEQHQQKQQEQQQQEQQQQEQQQQRQRVKKRSPSESHSPSGMSSVSLVITRPAKKQKRPSSNGDDSENEKSYSSESEETIYSEQGYETVAICSVFEEESEEEEDDIESAYVDNGNHTEYEVDSEADRRADDQLNDGNSSAEDSDVQDVVLAATAAALMEGEIDEGSFFADSESDESDSSAGEPLKYFDPEVGSNENWHCKQCNAPNLPFVGFCNSCWQVKTMRNGS